jgi:hypothetical protein
MKKIIPQAIHKMIFNHENPEEAPSIELPRNSKIPPANVQIIAASKRRTRFETLNLIDFKEFIYS